MKQLSIDVKECEPGDILAQEVVAENGILIIPVNTVLTEKIIDVLLNFNVKKVSVFKTGGTEEYQSQMHQDHNAGFQNFKVHYINIINYLGQALNEVALGKEIDGEVIESISFTLYDELKNNQDVAKYLYQMSHYSEQLYTHSMNVAIYAMMLAQWLGCTEYHIRNIIAAGLLHDIGKIAIPKQILEKKEPLTEDEVQILNKHPIYGYRMSKRIHSLNEETRHVILRHHERQDGSGYPEGLQANRLNYYTRIVAIADTYDMLLTDYQSGRKNIPFEVFEKLHGIHMNQLDIQYASTFLSRISICYNGSKIKLSNGAIGEVVTTLPHCMSKPIIKINGQYIDTSHHQDLEIVEILGAAS